MEKLYKYDIISNWIPNRKYITWKCFDKISQIDNYKLFNSNIIQTYFSDNLLQSGKHFNHLNNFLSEAVCILYPYMNNLKTDVIGFQHYKRYFHSDIIYQNYNLYEDNTVQIFTKGNINNYVRACIHNWHLSQEMIDDFLSFVHTKFDDKYIYANVFYKKEIFVCNWKTYCEIAQIILEYIEFINKKYELEYDYIKWYKHIQIKYLRECKNDDPFKSHYKRIYSLLIELIISIWISSKNIYFDSKNTLCEV